MPPARFVLVHTLSHLLLHQVALQCGYSTASIRERLYCRESGDPEGPPMSGVLLYTASPDSEGTLGGLVALSEPARLAAVLRDAVSRAKLCSTDPMCAGHHAGELGDTLHNAACHACLFVPETSCEASNRYLRPRSSSPDSRPFRQRLLHMSDAVTDTAVEAALHVPGELLAAGAETVENAPGWSMGSHSALINASPAARYREHAETIAQAWSRTPDVAGAVVAATMRAAATAVGAVRAEHKVSLVWTGPSTKAVCPRLTRSVLAALVANATESLVLVSFASHDVAELTAALTGAIARGVDVTLILETPDDPGGPLVIGPTHPFAPIKDTASFYRWPCEARKALFAVTARLHAKCVIADRSSALITSANLTSAGINDNIELGVLIEAGSLPAMLHDHLSLLIEDRTLEEVG